MATIKIEAAIEEQILEAYDELDRFIWQTANDPDNRVDHVRRENELQRIAYQTARDLLERRVPKLKELIDARHEEQEREQAAEIWAENGWLRAAENAGYDDARADELRYGL